MTAVPRHRGAAVRPHILQDAPVAAIRVEAVLPAVRIRAEAVLPAADAPAVAVDKLYVIVPGRVVQVRMALFRERLKTLK